MGKLFCDPAATGTTFKVHKTVHSHKRMISITQYTKVYSLVRLDPHRWKINFDALSQNLTCFVDIHREPSPFKRMNSVRAISSALDHPSADDAITTALSRSRSELVGKAP